MPDSSHTPAPPDPRGMRTYLLDAYLDGLDDEWALIDNADADNLRANLQQAILRLIAVAQVRADFAAQVRTETLREAAALVESAPARWGLPHGIQGGVDWAVRLLRTAEPVTLPDERPQGADA